MLHVPILRHGEPDKSLDAARVPHHRTREPFVEIGQANAGLIRRDLRPEHEGNLFEHLCARRSLQQSAAALLAAADA